MLGRERIRIDGPFAPPAFRLVTIFALVILVPMALYLYLAHSTWMWMYAVDPATVPSLLFFPLLVAHGGALIVGWLIGARLVVVRRTKTAAYALIGGGVALAVATLVLWSRLGHYGTREEFEGGRALGLMEVKLGYVLITMILGLAAAATLVALQLARDSRRATSK